MTALIQLIPGPVTDSTVRAIAQYTHERLEGVTGTTLTLEHHFLAPVTAVFKNGTLLDPQASSPEYTLQGKTLTLGSAAIVTDVFWVHGVFRGA